MAIVLSRYGNQMVQVRSRSKKNRLSDQQKAILDTDFSAIYSRLASLKKKLEDRKIGLRIQRLGFAEKVIDESKEFKDRFMAAYVADLDGELLDRYFKENSALAQKNQAVLTPQTIPNQNYSPQSITAQADRVRQKAEDLVEKSLLFHPCLHC